MPYSSITPALTVTKLQAGIPNADRDTVLSDILEQSKGTLNGVSEYRPYLVAALAMHTSKPEQTLSSAEGGVSFRQSKDRMNLQAAIEGNLRLQMGIDVSQGTEVPIGWKAEEFLDSLCGCKAPGDAVTGVEDNPPYVFSAMVV